MSAGRVLATALVICASSSCAYFNSMWSANHYAGQARSAEHAGRTDEARSAWSMAATKAESVVSRHPHSRWAPAALVLQGEGLARSGSCDRAAAPLVRALDTVKDAALRERATLAAAACAIERGDPAVAESLAALVASSSNRTRASRASFLAGQAAELRGDPALAAARYVHSLDPGAASARAHALLRQGLTAAAVALTDTLTRTAVPDTNWSPLLDDVARAADVATASRLLDQVLVHTRYPAATRARLLVADGDRLFAAGAMDSAEGRYRDAEHLVPDSAVGEVARVRGVRTAAARCRGRADLQVLREALSRMIATGLDGNAAAEGKALQELMGRILITDDAEDALWFRAAELARDSLGAPDLAAALFLGLAHDHPRSLFAAKALTAVAALGNAAHDSVLTLLQVSYPTSPYTLALAGDMSPAYAAAEDSLAAALGATVAAVPNPVASQIVPPIPGPRGPLLDPVLGPAAAASAPARKPTRADAHPERRRALKPSDRQ